jgi:SAM-dependent methyltransferase
MIMDIQESYDSAALAYVEHLASELAGKPLDRHLLHRFAEETRDRGPVADLGCGPGHVAKYLQALGVRMIGVDISPKMIECAKRLAPDVAFRVDDVRSLNFSDGEIAGVVAFYLIVHFEPTELEDVLREMRRVLEPGGVAFLSFHVGDGVIHRDELFGAPVNLDFRFHHTKEVISALEAAGLAVFEQIEREPYEAEYPSRRCYLFARASRAPKLSEE